MHANKRQRTSNDEVVSEGCVTLGVALVLQTRCADATDCTVDAVFDESISPLDTTPKSIWTRNTIPDVVDIFDLVRRLTIAFNIDSEVLVSALILMDKLLESTERRGMLRQCTLRPLLIAALVVSYKSLNDHGVWSSDLIVLLRRHQLLPGLTLDRIKQLESQLLHALGWCTFVPARVYTQQLSEVNRAVLRVLPVLRSHASAPLQRAFSGWQSDQEQLLPAADEGATRVCGEKHQREQGPQHAVRCNSYSGIPAAAPHKVVTAVKICV